jgi:hypothetical protein
MLGCEGANMVNNFLDALWVWRMYSNQPAQEQRVNHAKGG